MPDEPSSVEQHTNGASDQEGASSTAPAQDVRQESKPTKPRKEAPPSSAKDGKKASTVPAKRKAKASDEPSKAPRRSGRGAPQPSVEPAKMLQFLLSPDSADLCRPKDETEDIKTRGEIKNYSSSALSPFEELLCAVILSRPISHALGLRTIRTVFNDPYNFTSPKALRGAGSEGRHKALFAARTQHKQKTADELGLIADNALKNIADSEDDVSLEKVRRDGEHDPGKERQLLQKSIKGLGKTGLDIFARRIQGVWPAFYPFVDQKTASALQHLGLPSDEEELKELVEKHMKDLDLKGIEAADDEEKERMVFVRILERAVGADLEGNTDAVKAKAA